MGSCCGSDDLLKAIKADKDLNEVNTLSSRRTNTGRRASPKMSNKQPLMDAKTLELEEKKASLDLLSVGVRADNSNRHETGRVSVGGSFITKDQSARAGFDRLNNTSVA